jgi:hypothetical protein
MMTVTTTTVLTDTIPTRAHVRGRSALLFRLVSAFAHRSRELSARRDPVSAKKILQNTKANFTKMF